MKIVPYIEVKYNDKIYCIASYIIDDLKTRNPDVEESTLIEAFLIEELKNRNNGETK
mgnify:FL=1